jgi:hypothetical protein
MIIIIKSEYYSNKDKFYLKNIKMIIVMDTKRNFCLEMFL